MRSQFRQSRTRFGDDPSAACPPGPETIHRVVGESGEYRKTEAAAHCPKLSFQHGQSEGRLFLKEVIYFWLCRSPSLPSVLLKKKGRTCICSWRTASSSFGSTPKTFSIVGATCWLDTGVFTCCDFIPGNESSRTV